MACKEFNQWVKEVGPVQAARLVSEHSKSRGKRGVYYQNIQEWVAKDIPLGRVLDVEAVSGLSRHKLNPDLYPMEVAS